MKRDYPRLKAVILSSVLLASLEYCIVLITGDYDSPCFWHNSVMGGLISWMLRITFFTLLTVFFYQLLIPKYKSLKDRMIERDEEKNKQRKVERSLQLGNYGYETN